MIRIAAATVACMTMLNVGAQVSIDPPSPKAFFEIRVKVSSASLGPDQDSRGDSYEPYMTTVSMVGNRITVSPLMLGAPDFAAALPTPPLDQSIGALPPGTYQLDVVKRASGRGRAGQVGTTVTFTVPPRADADPFTSYSDLWWVPSESGWGLSLHHHNTNQMFASLFVYAGDNRPTWYVIPSGTFLAGHRFRGTIYKAVGPFFGGPFDPTAVSALPAGEATITFNAFDLNKASISFTIDGVSFVKAIQRQSF